jgi:hypothetical protein
MSAAARAEDGGSVDHVGNPHYPAELTRFARSLVVERFDFDLLGTQQASQARLTTPITPYLTNHSRRHRQRIADLDGAGEKRNDSPVIALEGDQRACVQSETAHGRLFPLRAGFFVTPSARSAARRSAALRGPPDSASISESSVASSSSLVFSSNALAT